MKNIAKLLLLLFLTISCTDTKNRYKLSEENLIINLKKIVGKTPDEIESILGKPEKIEKVSPNNTPCKESSCNKNFYKEGTLEIVFINNKADWITINNLRLYGFDEGILNFLGLSTKQPSNKNQNFIRWQNLENIKEINVYNNGNNNIDYIYIKAITE